MGHIEPLDRSELPEHEAFFGIVESTMGFVPSSMLTMGKLPPLLDAFNHLASTVMTLGEIDSGLVQMVANVASQAAGCRYCQAHTAANAAHAGVDDAKLAALWEFETSEVFSAAERAALRVARDAAQVPNVVTEAHFAELAEHYTEAQILHIVATISMFGFLNRWNDTMATTLEEAPSALAATTLAGSGWTPGKHA